MIVMIEKRKPYGAFAEVEYQFVEGDKIEYAGDILKHGQKENLLVHGNTIIPNTMYRTLGKEKILEEVERLTNLKCEIKVKHSETGTTIILKVIPEWALDTRGANTYKLLNYGKLYYTWPKDVHTLFMVEEDIKNMGIEKYEKR